MKRRDFFRKGAIASAGVGFLAGCNNIVIAEVEESKKKAKNIIFLVSDGMSSGTLNMADLYSRRKFGRDSHWMNLYKENKISRALMDTASLDSVVTDSAAGGSSWGSGYRVNNGSVNIGANGEEYKPILQKFKAVGKKVGCVTTVPITHATPASFCINHKTRNAQPLFAEKYLDLKFDVMMGGGYEHFEQREDGKKLFKEFEDAGFTVLQTKKEWQNANTNQPVLGVFYENGLPYTLDHQQDSDLAENVPTLADMTQFAIDAMKNHPEGFVMQVEGGKVDWAAHANDAGAIINDQIAFDDAVKTAIDFAEKDGETLVIITTDHGNANPALIKGKRTDENFEKFLNFKHTNEWVLFQLNQQSSVKEIIEMFEFAQSIVFKEDDAKLIRNHFAKMKDDELYNPYKLPFHQVAKIQEKHTNVGWACDDHTSDFVELAMYGPGSNKLLPFVKNTDLHYFMLEVAEVEI